MRKVRIVKLLGARSAVALAAVLVLASGGRTPSAGQVNSGGGAAAPRQDVVKGVRQTTTFGTLGIIDGQTVRLSAVRAGEGDPGTPCKVDLNFFDTQGNRQGAGVSADLRPRQAAFFDLSRADIHQETGEPRAQIYAVVDVTSAAAEKDEPTCHVAMSIEIFEQHGRTQIYQGAFSTSKTPTSLNCCTVECPRIPGIGQSICVNCVNPPQLAKCPTCSRGGGCVFP